MLGRLPILLVRMNADLAMGDAVLKKTGSANLFTVFDERQGRREGDQPRRRRGAQGLPGMTVPRR